MTGADAAVSAPPAGSRRARRTSTSFAFDRRVILDVTAITLLLAVGVVGFAPTFDSPRYLVAAVGGLVLGLGIAVLGAWRRFGLFTLSGITVAAYLLLGGALALPQTTILGVIPTLETWRQLLVGVVTAWKRLLTTVPPVATDDGHMLVPLIMTLTAAVVAGSLALRVLPAAWALLPTAVYLGAQILLGVAEPAAPFVQGVLFGVVAVTWLALRQLWDPNRDTGRIEAADADGSARTAARSRRLLTGSAVLAIAAVVGGVSAAVAVPPTQRYILRDFVVPPFDVHEYPSPLQSFRGYVRDSAEDPLFTVSALPDDARIRLATMDAYNGIVYNVADDGAGSSSAFTPVRSNMSPEATGTSARIEVTIEGLEGVWLPSVGAARELDFGDGDRADRLRRSAHYNDATGTAVTTARVAAGDTYRVDAVIPRIPSDNALSQAAFAPVKMPAQQGVPEGIIEDASDAIEEAETPIERARGLASWFSTEGYFSHGLEGEVLSPSGHGAARIAQLLSGRDMIGDDEQYAVAMALVANQLGMPARVVMGWYPDEAGDGTFTATGENLHAWVEIAFEGAGWVPFDPTPDEDNEPDQQSTTPRADPQPQVLQPPPPAQEPADLPPTIADERDQEDEEEVSLDWLGPVLLIGGLSLGVIALILAPFLIIGAIKATRRVRRRRAERAADRISGGWDELVDSAIDLRAPVRRGATRSESAEVVAASWDAERVTALADRADAEVYGPGEPSAEQIDAFWAEVDDIVGGMMGSTSWWQRLRARVSLRSFRPGGGRRTGGAA